MDRQRPRRHDKFHCKVSEVESQGWVDYKSQKYSKRPDARHRDSRTFNTERSDRRDKQPDTHADTNVSHRRDRQRTRRLDRKRHTSDFEHQSCDLKCGIVQQRQDNERRDTVVERHAAEAVAVSDRHSENRLHGGGVADRRRCLPPGDLIYEVMELKQQRRSKGGSQLQLPKSPTESLPEDQVSLVFFAGLRGEVFLN